MNTHLIAQQAKKFGDQIEIITDCIALEMDDLVQELKSIGIQSLVHTGIGEKEDFARYDVSIVVGLNREYFQNYYNKTLLIIDDEETTAYNQADMQHLTSNDKWVWNGSDFIQRVNNELSISDLGESNSRNSGNYDVVLRSSFSPLLPYFESGRLFPIYAGPIREHAIDQLAVLDLVDFIKKKIYNGIEYFAFDDKDEAMYWTRLYTCHSICLLYTSPSPRD